MNAVHAIFYGVFSDVFEAALCMEVDVSALCYHSSYNALRVKLDLFKDLSIRIEYSLNAYSNISIYVTEGNRVFSLVSKTSMAAEFPAVSPHLNILVLVVDSCRPSSIKVCSVLEALAKTVKPTPIRCVVVARGVTVRGG